MIFFNVVNLLTNRRKSRTLLCLGACLLLTIAFLWPSYTNGWVNWDDHGYVFQNDLVIAFSWDRLSEVFTTLQVVGLYHPLTVLSLVLDYQIGGTDPFIYHLTNNLLHLLNVGFTFWLIFLMTKRIDMSAIVALLFGFHPMHIESVAWVSARKDVLYALFLLSALVTYVYFLKSTGKHRMVLYAVCFLLFSCSLLSKLMATTFPVFLLMFDFLYYRKDYKNIILEKLPFFAGSLLMGVIGILGQREAAAVEVITNYPFYQTIFVACYSLMTNIFKVIVPFQLSPFHPYPFMNVETMSWVFYGSILPFALFCYFVMKSKRYTRKIIFGVGFMIVSIAPSLQILPVGRAMMAERYTYVAYIGLFFVLALFYVWFSRRVTQFGKQYAPYVKVLMAVFILWMGSISYQRCQIWLNGETLWSDAIEKYPDDYFAYANRADYYYKSKQFDKALIDFNKSIELFSGFSDVFNNRGRLHQYSQRYELALADYNQAIETDPLNDAAYINRAIVLLSQHNDISGARRDLLMALESNPVNPLAYINLGVLHEMTKQFTEAESYYAKGLDVLPRHDRLWQYRGLIRQKQGNFQGALTDYSTAISLAPTGRSYYLRAKLNHAEGNQKEAKEDILKARELGFPVDDNLFDKLIK